MSIVSLVGSWSCAMHPNDRKSSAPPPCAPAAPATTVPIAASRDLSGGRSAYQKPAHLAHLAETLAEAEDEGAAGPADGFEIAATMAAMEQAPDLAGDDFMLQAGALAREDSGVGDFGCA
eukprot:gene4291-4119_t